MLPVESTYELLALKSLDRSINEKWVIWAIDMLEAGFDTEHLRILAGAERPYNHFYIQDLVEKVLPELGFDYSSKERNLNNYVFYLIKEVLKGIKNILTALSSIYDIHIEQSFDTPYRDFYLLYHAKKTLLDYTEQWYWPDADRSNIDEVITQYFKKWMVENNYAPI